MTRFEGNVALRSILSCLLFVLVVGNAGVRAQELQARAYAPAPVGLNFLAVGVGYSTGDVLLDSSLPVLDLNTDLTSTLFAYTRTLGIAGKLAKVKVELPLQNAEWSGTLTTGEKRSRDVDGLGDGRVTLEVNILGSPALKMKEFAGYRQKSVLGVSAQVRIPTGDYDDTKLLNLGGNRWGFRPEIAGSLAIKRWIVEAAGTAWFYTDNDDFFGGLTLEQDPIYAAQLHGIYNFRRPGFWVGIGVGWATGGKTFVDGEAANEFQNNTRSGIRLAYPLNRRNGLVFDFSRGVTTRLGADFDNYAVVYQHMFGGPRMPRPVGTE